MGCILDKIMLPGVCTYSANDIKSPPLVFKVGVPCLKLVPAHYNKVVLYMHGNAEDLGTLRRSMVAVPERLKAIVYCMEYRGYGIHHVSCSTSPQGTVIDGNRVIHALEREHGTKIHLIGYSVGTAVASAVAAASTDKVASLTLLSPFHSPRAMVEQRLKDKWIAELVAPSTHPFNTASNLVKYGRPVLTIHGTHDTIVPLEHARRLEHELGKDKFTLIEKPNVDHVLRVEELVEDILNHMIS